MKHLHRRNPLRLRKALYGDGIRLGRPALCGAGRPPHPL